VEWEINRGGEILRIFLKTVSVLLAYACSILVTFLEDSSSKTVGTLLLPVVLAIRVKLLFRIFNPGTNTVVASTSSTGSSNKSKMFA
jgi:hypothetical protein